ncbi:uncharacterized protein LOC123315451 [Coccinella septempunctata]|uniref:uncharacterized protein LOC123315451 n=1 Tax=Coccinella septempunctata TaxID=41139 RepID=UPI001D074641|nr:uncharacterized protein LOC123315451 [Coccinella septempunctata]
MKHHKIYICAISESKRKGKGTLKVPGFILIYSGVEKQRRATGGVAMLIAEKYGDNIEDIHYVNQRILEVTLQTGSEKIHIFSVYAPDSSRRREDTDTFYDLL